MKQHHYKTTLKWTGNTGNGTTSYRGYKRDYELIVENKETIKGSADSAFLGNPEKHNPEEMFLASISSCHLLWYLHLCAESGITVVAYEDKATAKMIENKDGSGQFEEVTLHPQILIKEKEKLELAYTLHHVANQKCFIANSCNFKIQHSAEIQCV